MIDPLLAQFRLMELLYEKRSFTKDQAVSASGLHGDAVDRTLKEYARLLEIVTVHGRTKYILPDDAAEIWYELTDRLKRICIDAKVFTTITEDEMEERYEEALASIHLAVNNLTDTYPVLGKTIAKRQELLDQAEKDVFPARALLAEADRGIPEAPRTLELKASYIRFQRLLERRRIELSADMPERYC